MKEVEEGERMTEEEDGKKEVEVEHERERKELA